jgi:hypothetical protein
MAVSMKMAVFWVVALCRRYNPEDSHLDYKLTEKLKSNYVAFLKPALTCVIHSQVFQFHSVCHLTAHWSSNQMPMVAQSRPWPQKSPGTTPLTFMSDDVYVAPTLNRIEALKYLKINCTEIITFFIYYDNLTNTQAFP